MITKEMDKVIMDEIRKLEVSCPACEIQFDDQYQCEVCGTAGGRGFIRVEEYLRKKHERA